MAKIIVEHEEYGKVLFDTETQQYEYYKSEDNVYFNYNNGRLPYFDNAQLFLESNVNLCVVPMICSEAKAHKRRTYIDMIDRANYTYKFFNVEMIDSKWIENKISGAYKNYFYFCILKRDNGAMNDFRLMSTLEMKKGMHKHTP